MKINYSAMIMNNLIKKRGYFSRIRGGYFSRVMMAGFNMCGVLPRERSVCRRLFFRINQGVPHIGK